MHVSACVVICFAVVFNFFDICFQIESSIKPGKLNYTRWGFFFCVAIGYRGSASFVALYTYIRSTNLPATKSQNTSNNNETVNGERENPLHPCESPSLRYGCTPQGIGEYSCPHAHASGVKGRSGGSGRGCQGDAERRGECKRGENHVT